MTKDIHSGAVVGKISLVQVGSPIRRPRYQRATLIGLGLNKLHRRVTLDDTPAVRGMVRRVQHLVHVVSESDGEGYQ